MEFKFEANQEYQKKAIESVVKLFEGHPETQPELTFTLGETAYAHIPNRLDIDEARLLQNLQKVQAENALPLDPALSCIEERIESPTGSILTHFPNFSVEMETGTGKTYVYIRTAMELHRRYGMRKFIIVVPSVAVRQGVLKTFQVTEAHLRSLYDNPTYRYYVYDSDKLHLVKQFALSADLEFMIMTLDAFNKSVNVINSVTDRLPGVPVPVRLVQSARPILILDEPQNMESEQSVKALATLHPLLALRYSATHKNAYNAVYRLTPYEAYRQALVKRIEVAGVRKDGEGTGVFLRLDGVEAKGRTFSARIAIHKLTKTGKAKEQVVTVRPGDSLEQKSGSSDYAGYEVKSISLNSGTVRFANGVEIGAGTTVGSDKEAIFEAQVRYTIERHFLKQRKLKAAGVKVLSLFFIDKVGNYTSNDDPMIKRLFNQAFDELKTQYPEWQHLSASAVQAAYFAQKKRKDGSVEYLDTAFGKPKKEDEAAYNLIMNDKERLLSFSEPVSFIFSHSALREGWDNPNVFQICTLNQSVSEVRKRQEIGRGLRLSVDQTGVRVFDPQINVLTVVANESYESYVTKLQQQIEEDYGTEGAPPKPPNAMSPAVSTLRKAHVLRPEFQELWNKIREKTRYTVSIDTDALLAEVLPEIDQISVNPLRITITQGEVAVGSKDAFVAFESSQPFTAVDLTGRYPLPNLIKTMEDLLERTTDPVRLTRRTLLEILKRTSNLSAAMANPFEFASQAVRVIKNKLADHFLSGIQYEKVGDHYEMTQWEATIDSWTQYLEPSIRPDGSEGVSIYDQVIVESDSIEREFVKGLEQKLSVKLYVKLPRWFTVDTPVGEYNPDWAIVWEDRDKFGQTTGKPLLYLVRETKPSRNLDTLRPEERRKILYGKKHFTDALDVDYDVVTSASELPK